MTTALRWFTAIVGLGLLIAGAAGAAKNWTTEALSLVFAFGFACLLLALVADRIVGIIFERGEDGSTKIKFGSYPNGTNGTEGDRSFRGGRNIRIRSQSARR